MVMRAQGRSCAGSCKKGGGVGWGGSSKAVIENRNTTADHTRTGKPPQVVIFLLYVDTE